jgi:hypothetical protein
MRKGSGILAQNSNAHRQGSHHGQPEIGNEERRYRKVGFSVFVIPAARSCCQMRVPLSLSDFRAREGARRWRGRHRWTDHFLRERRDLWRGWRGYFPIT